MRCDVSIARWKKYSSFLVLNNSNILGCVITDVGLSIVQAANPTVRACSSVCEMFPEMKYSEESAQITAPYMLRISCTKEYQPISIHTNWQQ